MILKCQIMLTTDKGKVGMVSMSVVASKILYHQRMDRSVDRSMTCILASAGLQSRFDEYRGGFGQIKLGDNKPYIIGKYTT